MMERIDIHVEAPRVDGVEHCARLSDNTLGEPSASVRARVEAARARQRVRLAGTALYGSTLPRRRRAGTCGGTPVLRAGPGGAEPDRGGDASVGAERAGVPPRAKAVADDCRPGGERGHRGAAPGGGAAVSTAAEGTAFSLPRG